MTLRIRPTANALLLRQIGEVLYGASWQTVFSERLNLSDRSMRRWASGEDEMPPGIWREIHHLADSQRLTLEHLAPQIVPILHENKLHPIPNTQPMPDSWGLHFTLATTRGRPVRCFIRREVLDDRVSYQRMIYVFDYFRDHADVFYRVAQRKYDRGEFDEGNLISIGNADVLGEELPDIRNGWRADSSRNAAMPARPKAIKVGPSRGTITTKEDVQAFVDSCVALRSLWCHFQILFHGTDLKRELLQTTAPTLFGDLNGLFIEHLILRICRLTDNAQMAGRKNLTVKFLIEHSDFSNAPEIFAKLQRISADIDAFRTMILPARHRFISHLDLESVRLDQSLGAASDEEWNKFWLDLQDFLELMLKHHVDPNSHFYLNGIAALSDADSLLTALVNAKLLHAVLADREIATRAMRAADTCKFASSHL